MTAKDKIELPLLAQIAKEAGEAIMAMQHDIVLHKRWKLKEDNSPVTEADKAGHLIIAARLKEYFPAIPFVSEEGDPAENAAALQAAERFEADPLDNTSGFIQGYDTYSVNLGRIKDGVPVAGAVYFPVKQELFFTGDDNKAYLQKGDAAPVEITVRTGPLADPVRVASGFNATTLEHLSGRNFDVIKYAAQYRTCMIAAGDCDISGISKGGRGGYESWDLAGPHAVLLAAGGEMVTLEGKPLRYGNTSALPTHIAGSRAALTELALLDESPSAAKPEPLAVRKNTKPGPASP